VLFPLVSWDGERRKSTWYVGHYLAYCTSPGRWMVMGVEQTVKCDPGSNPDRRSGKPATNRPPSVFTRTQHLTINALCGVGQRCLVVSRLSALSARSSSAPVIAVGWSCCLQHEEYFPVQS
jgi:hypothetical protein